jgi:hypothetical protein
MGQVPGEEGQVRGGLEAPDFRHGPGQKPGFGMGRVAVFQMRVGKKGEAEVGISRLGAAGEGKAGFGKGCRQSYPQKLYKITAIHKISRNDRPTHSAQVWTPVPPGVVLQVKIVCNPACFPWEDE